LHIKSPESFQQIIQKTIVKSPQTEGFVMSVEDTATRIGFKRPQETNYDENLPFSREVAVIKIKPTSRVLTLPLKQCNQAGKQQYRYTDEFGVQHEDRIVYRVPWISKSDHRERWTAAHTQNNRDFDIAHWQTVWSNMDPPEDRPPEGYGAFYRIYSMISPNAEPEFAVAVGQDARAGDIYDQLHPPATTSPAAGGAASDAVGAPARDTEEVQEEEGLPPAKLPRLPQPPRRVNTGSWHPEDPAGRSGSRVNPTKDEVVESDANDVFDLSRLYPPFYLRMLSTNL